MIYIALTLMIVNLDHQSIEGRRQVWRKDFVVGKMACGPISRLVAKLRLRGKARGSLQATTWLSESSYTTFILVAEIVLGPRDIATVVSASRHYLGRNLTRLTIFFPVRSRSRPRDALLFVQGLWT